MILLLISELKDKTEYPPVLNVPLVAVSFAGGQTSHNLPSLAQLEGSRLSTASHAHPLTSHTPSHTSHTSHTLPLTSHTGHTPVLGSHTPSLPPPASSGHFPGHQHASTNLLELTQMVEQLQAVHNMHTRGEQIIIK